MEPPLGLAQHRQYRASDLEAARLFFRIQDLDRVAASQDYQQWLDGIGRVPGYSSISLSWYVALSLC